MNQPTNNQGNDISSILHADDFLRSSGHLTSYHFNNLVLTTLCAVPKLKNVAFDIDQNKRTLHAIFYLSRFGMVFYNKDKITKTALALYREYLSEYSYSSEFRIYKK